MAEKTDQIYTTLLILYILNFLITNSLSYWKDTHIFLCLGEEPTYSKTLGIHCQPCSDQERFEPLENTRSYTYSECRRKKNACPVGVSVECPNASHKYSQNRKCRCLYEMEFVPQDYDMARDTWRCADPDHLNCVQEICPETADGRKQFRSSGMELKFSFKKLCVW